MLSVRAVCLGWMNSWAVYGGASKTIYIGATSGSNPCDIILSIKNKRGIKQSQRWKTIRQKSWRHAVVVVLCCCFFSLWCCPLLLMLLLPLLLLFTLRKICLFLEISMIHFLSLEMSYFIFPAFANSIKPFLQPAPPNSVLLFQHFFHFPTFPSLSPPFECERVIHLLLLLVVWRRLL